MHQALGNAVPNPVVATVAAVLFLFFCARIVVSDICSRRISNSHCMAVAGLAIIWWIGIEGGAGLISFMRQLALASLIAIPLLGLFALRVFGGGDVKLLLALLLWVPASSLIGMFIIILLSGGVLALMLMALSRIFCAIKSDTVPYGVPIIVGSLLALAPAFVTALY